MNVQIIFMSQVTPHLLLLEADNKLPLANGYTLPMIFPLRSKTCTGMQILRARDLGPWIRIPNGT
jgi:hypothetical protein